MSFGMRRKPRPRKIKVVAKKNGKKLMKYGFVIPVREEFDFHRILKEVKQDEPNAVGFIVSGPRNAYAILFQKFLGKFTSEDLVYVDQGKLHTGWGNGLRHLDLNPSNYLVASPMNGRILVRGLPIGNATIPIVAKQIQEAKEYKRRIKIRVTVF